MTQRTRTVYTFRCDGTYPNITMVRTTYPRRTAATRHTLTLSTYNRFVALANSQQYNVWILGGDFICWELWRDA